MHEWETQEAHAASPRGRGQVLGYCSSSSRRHHQTDLSRSNVLAFSIVSRPQIDAPPVGPAYPANPNNLEANKVQANPNDYGSPSKLTDKAAVSVNDASGNKNGSYLPEQDGRVSGINGTGSNIKQPDNLHGSGLNFNQESNQKESLLKNGSAP